VEEARGRQHRTERDLAGGRIVELGDGRAAAGEQEPSVAERRRGVPAPGERRQRGGRPARIDEQRSRRRGVDRHAQPIAPRDLDPRHARRPAGVPRDRRRDPQQHAPARVVDLGDLARAAGGAEREPFGELQRVLEIARGLDEVLDPARVDEAHGRAGGRCLHQRAPLDARVPAAAYANRARIAVATEHQPAAVGARDQPVRAQRGARLAP
jgi:hypothetical protein